jgi:hypothetical protein
MSSFSALTELRRPERQGVTVAEKLHLGGREYRHAGSDITVRQDLFIMMQARHAGLMGCVQHDGEEPEAYAERLLATCLASGRALLLLGGMIVPAASKVEDWTEEMAHETAGALGGITDHDEKLELYGAFATTIMVFFKAGRGSWVSSARSSQGAPTGSSSMNDTVSGADSSEPSPATTTTALESSSAGR